MIATKCPGVLVVGERINASRPQVREAMRERRGAFIIREAQMQMSAGADVLDVNAGTEVRTEVEDLVWLVETIQGALDVPLSVDTANPRALEAALKAHRGRAIVNSATAEASRFNAVIGPVLKWDATLVGLAMDERGMPTGVEDRLALAGKLAEMCDRAGLSRDRLYVDPLLKPLSTNPEEALMVVESVRRMRRQGAVPGVHAICGLSNVSFGLPRRNVLNNVYLALLVAAGMDGFIIDPTEDRMMATLYAARAVAGEDDFCMNYIGAARAGMIK